MARPLRIEYPRAFYHVLSRGIERRPIYWDAADRLKFLESVQKAISKYHIQVYAYCLMGNHYHLLLQTMDGNLSRVMQYINGGYVTYFNTKRKRVGHLFASRYKGIVVDKDSYLKELTRYIHLNPVRAKMVEKPEDYRWSSYNAYLGRTKTVWLNADWVLGVFSSIETVALQRYKSFVEEGIDRDVEDPFKAVVASTVLGKESFVEQMKEQLKRKDKEQKRTEEIKKLSLFPSLHKIEEFVGEEFRDLNVKLRRKIAVYLSYQYSGKKLREIGAKFGEIGRKGVYGLLKRFSMELRQNELLQDRLHKSSDKLKSEGGSILETGDN